MMPSENRWLGLVGIAVGNVLPLQLVWTGRLDVHDLVLVYLLELVVAFGLACAGGPPSQMKDQGLLERAKFWGSVSVVTLLVGGPMTYYTVGPVSWDAATAWVVLAAFLSFLIGTVATIRRRGRGWRRGHGGAFLWRLVLMVVALLAANAGSAYGRLVAASWEPHSFGNGLALPAGELLTGLALRLDLSPVVVTAGILCTYRLVSEVLHEVYDVFRDEAAAASWSRSVDQ